MKNATRIKAETPIVIEGPKKQYESKPVLQGMSAQISASGVTAILGKTVAGKTSLIKRGLSVEKVSSGKVAIFGEKSGSCKVRQARKQCLITIGRLTRKYVHSLPFVKMIYGVFSVMETSEIALNYYRFSIIFD